MRTAQKGFTLVEVMVTVILAVGLVLAITALGVQTRKITRLNLVELRASFFASEAIEVAKDLEFSNWNHLKTATCTSAAPCHPVQPSAGGAWTLVAGAETLDNFFTRSVWIEQVQRLNCAPTFPIDIVASGVICPTPANPDTLKYVARVTWNDDSGAHVQRIETYVYNLP